MRGLVLIATAPVWFPILCLAGMASVGLGMGLVVMTTALRDRPTSDRWMYGRDDLD